MISAVHRAGKSIQNFNPSNIFISKEGRLKLLNFSIGKKFTEFFNKSKTFINGDPLYLAPEIILKGVVFPESDVWSLGGSSEGANSEGVITFELLTGRNPYNEDAGRVWTIFHSLNKEPPRLPVNFSPNLQQFIRDCLQKNPKNRLKIAELANSSTWLKNCQLPSFLSRARGTNWESCTWTISREKF